MTAMKNIGWTILTLALLAGGEAWGQSRFDGSTDSKWVTADNWTPAVVPTATSNVVIGTTNAAVGATGSPMTATIGSSDNCLANSLTLGEHPSNVGTLTMTDGTLTFPAAGNITVAGQASSVGALNQTGGTLSGITSGTLTIGSGANSVGSITLGNNSSITSAVVIASVTGASGTFTLTNSAQWKNTAGARSIGSAAGAVGSLNVYGGGSADLAAQTLTFGSLSGSTGIVAVSGSGVITNVSTLTIGGTGGGYGLLTVGETGRVYATTINVGGTNIVNSTILVTSNAYVKGTPIIGNAAYSVGTVILSNNAVWLGGGGSSVVGNGANSIGYLYVRDRAALANVPYQYMHVGYGAGSTGIVQVTDFGSITNVYFLYIGYNKGYGDVTVSGSGVVAVTEAPLTPGAIYLSPTGGVSSSLTVTNAGVVRGLRDIGGGADGIATVRLTGDSRTTGGGTTVGVAARSTGYLYVNSNATLTSSLQPFTVGAGVGSTGIVEVSDNGVITNYSGATIGPAGAGFGRMTVRNSGKFYLTSSGVSIGGTNNNSILTVADDGLVRTTGNTILGHAAGASGTLTVTNNALYSQAGGEIQVGAGAGSIGWINVNGGKLDQPFAGSIIKIGTGSGATGIVTITSGEFASNGDAGQSWPTTVGFGVNSVGTINLQGGILREGGLMTLGAAAGAVGRVTVTGGTWYQRDLLNIGVTASGTGLVTVANCVSTNITGAITVGSGTVVGDRYGLVTVSNATFGGATAVTVWTNGFVELTGTNRFFRCNTFTGNGGYLTNHVRQAAGGLDILGTAATSLSVTNGTIHLAFDENPKALGTYDFWGLRWAGTNGYSRLVSYTNSGLITVANNLASPFNGKAIEVYKAPDNSYTYIGFLAKVAPVGTMVVFR